jgi:hypothetical protein
VQRADVRRIAAAAFYPFFRYFARIFALNADRTCCCSLSSASLVPSFASSSLCALPPGVGFSSSAEPLSSGP